MLLEGQCGSGPKAAAEKFGLSRQRYFQLRQQFQQFGAQGLVPQKRGPKRNYRRTGELVRQVIRHLFLDPDANADVVAQKLRQVSWRISTRSVERVIQDFALQKNSTATARKPNHPSKHNAPFFTPGSSRPTPKASSVACGNFWPTKPPATS
jgi:hypothetical protein